MNAYTQCNQPGLALSVWKEAREASVALNHVGITCALQACAQLRGTPDVTEIIEELIDATQLVHQTSDCSLPFVMPTVSAAFLTAHCNTSSKKDSQHEP
jgi:hypothetical protein